MIDPFYRAFEDKYRGSRGLITERLHVYLPFIRNVLQNYNGGQAIDLGCGRGEWLELLIKEGFTPTGVDLDEGMLNACQQLGLPTVQADALNFLSQTESNSQLVVSAFHVVEHIGFEQLRALVTQALRVLRPGGLLILETPNPENIAVATRLFYLDPSHQRPIPPELLEFVVEFTGFDRVKTLRLQEQKDIAVRERIGIHEVFNCVIPDYAVVAQKKSNSPLVVKNQELFDANYGISLDTLSSKLDQRLERIEAQSMQAQIASEQLVVLLRNIYASKSWRLTAPLRWFMHQWRLLRLHGVVARTQAFVKSKHK
jgi:O-antigen chain-terminating methyltransferase